MKCQICHFVNRERVKFCEKCGAKLELVCPACRAKVPSDRQFCGKCGYALNKVAEVPTIDFAQPESYTPKFLVDKILNNRNSMEGERKVVTVLFADVVNYTALAEKLDPEEIHQIMDGCFKILMDEIHRVEGTINQFTGDGIMALFGAPVAHEDHAQRACYAALSIQKAISEYGVKLKDDRGVNFLMRIGLNSGTVVVGSIGDDLRMDYTALGDTTNFAARIQQAAKPSEIWMSIETRTIVKDYFIDESVGDISLKGIVQPQSIYRLVCGRPSVHTRFEAALMRGMSELVGRQPEMEVLRAAFEKVKTGEAQVVDVVGEAGVGKSRIVYEFKRLLKTEMMFFSGFCVHYGRNINFLPIIDVVKEVFGIEEKMSEEKVGKQIEQLIGTELASMIHFYRNLLSLKVDDPKFNALNPEGRKFGTFEAVKNLLFYKSKEKPIVIFLEDVQWMDNISEEFFTYFSRTFLDHPILMLTAYRPEGVPSWAQGAHYQRLTLETLSSDNSIQFIHNILGGLALETDVEQRIVEKTEGNPFFVEEIVRELVDRGDVVKAGDQYISNRPIGQLEIPNTVQGLLAARIDRLSEDLKKTMQVASVIGRDFAYRILKTVMELGEELRKRLANLVDFQILYEKSLYPELEYIFKHSLTQEVAYESLLKQRRREIHGRIARAIEQLYEGRLEQHYELLAHHWELSDSPDRSIEYLVLAGEKSNRSQAATTAADFFTRALNQIAKLVKVPDPILMIRIRSGLANPLHSIGRVDESLENYQEAIKLAGETGDKQTVLKCLTEIPMLIYNTTLQNKVPDFCEQGLELALALEDKGAEARIMASYAYWRYLWQRSEEYETIHKALSLAKESGSPPAIFTANLMLSLQERWKGNPQKSLQHSEGMVEMLQSMFNIFLASTVSILRGWALTDLGKYYEAIKFQSQWIDILEQNSINMMLGRCCNGQGWTYSEVYDLEKAFYFNRRSLESAVNLRKINALLFSASEMQAQAEVNLMENQFEMGNIDEAWTLITQFEDISVDPAFDLIRERWSTRMKDLKGIILLNRGDLNGAEELANQCFNTSMERGMKKYVGKAKRLLGQVLTARGAYDLAEEKLMSSLLNLKEVGNPKQIWITHTALARLYEKTKRLDLVREQWKEAAIIAESTAECLKEEKLRTTFLNAGPIRKIMEQANR